MKIKAVIINDPSKECQKHAIDCLNLLSQRVSQQH